jgi:hypothetical protein
MRREHTLPPNAEINVPTFLQTALYFLASLRVAVAAPSTRPRPMLILRRLTAASFAGILALWRTLGLCRRYAGTIAWGRVRAVAQPPNAEALCRLILIDLSALFSAWRAFLRRLRLTEACSNRSAVRRYKSSCRRASDVDPLLSLQTDLARGPKLAGMGGDFFEIITVQGRVHAYRGS